MPARRADAVPVLPPPDWSALSAKTRIHLAAVGLFSLGRIRVRT